MCVFGTMFEGRESGCAVISNAAGGEGLELVGGLLEGWRRGWCVRSGNRRRKDAFVHGQGYIADIGEYMRALEEE